MSIKFRVLGGGYFGFGGGGKCRFHFHGREDFSDKWPQITLSDEFLRRAPCLSAPNHKLQSASDLKSRSPNRKNFPKTAVSGSSNRTFKSRDLRFEPLFKSPLESQCQFFVQQVRTMSFSEEVPTVLNSSSSEPLGAPFRRRQG